MDFEPIRCFSCGLVFTDGMYKQYQKLLPIHGPQKSLDMIERKSTFDPKAKPRLGLRRECCRNMLMTGVNLRETMLLYPTYPDRIQLVGAKFINDEDDDSSDSSVAKTSRGTSDSESTEVESKKSKTRKKGKAKAKKDIAESDSEEASEAETDPPSEPEKKIKKSSKKDKVRKGKKHESDSESD